MPDPMRVGRYHVVEEIGDGAMGRVWRGWDPDIGRAVAIKTVKAEYLTRDTREEYLHRFRREARAAGSLGHPNIVRIFDVGDDYFVMELVEGVTLADLLKHRGALGVEESLALLRPVADAVDEAHRAGIIHRDIKPANIMVQPDGRPKLMDFGVARLEGSANTADGQFFGSPSYMAPEQIAGGAPGPRADLFSLAVVAYEMLTGQRPFQGESITAIMYRVVNDAAPAPGTRVPTLPPQFDEVFRVALAKDPDNRFPTAAAFVAALSGEDVESLLAALVAGVPRGTRDERPDAQETVDFGGLAGGRAMHLLRRYAPWTAGAAALLGLASLAGRPWGAVVDADLARDTTLQVETDPRSAEVTVDGRRAGKAPVILRSVRRGSHRLQVSREGYAPAELTLQVGDGMGMVPLRFSLTPLTAALEVHTQEGVQVLLNGQPLGVTPLPQVRVSPGLHQVRLERPGYVTQVHARQARAGESLRVDAEMQPAAESGAADPPPSTLATTAASNEPVDMGEVLKPPRLLAGSAVDYPEAARRLQLEGSVLVDVTVEPDGRVGRVAVVESAGSLLDEAVVQGVSAWRFDPARLEGQPVRVRWRYRQTFRPR
jgi:TonB family protein